MSRRVDSVVAVCDSLPNQGRKNIPVIESKMAGKCHCFEICRNLSVCVVKVKKS